ncbi:MAG: ArgE/DapE family deacylase, partial [Alcaligenaceae bacterium]
MALEQSLRDKIISSVEAGFDAQISYTQDLIRLQSVRGEEYVIQDRVFDEFRNRGYAMERFEMDEAAITRHPGGSPFSEDHSRAPIVVGTHRPRHTTGRSLILQAHVDVVPPGPHSLWTHPPFDPVIEGDWLYG